MALVFKREKVDPALLEEIREATRLLAELQGEVVGVEQVLGLTAEIAQLKGDKTDLELELAKVKESHDRETREIEHKIGLHKKQVEHEIAAAKKETALTVREEALSAEKDRFKSEMKFMQDRFESEVQAQRVIVEQVLDRLPKFERTYQTVEHIGSPPQGEGTVKLALEASK